jgi:hypothetical protein
MAQGYAYPVGASGSTGTANSATVALSAANTHTTLVTASQKTQINSVLITNVSGGILPVYLYVRKSGGSSDLQIAYKRVLKEEYAVMPLVSADGRTSSTEANLAPNGINMLTELILNAGDVLKASCTVASAVNITVNFYEGVK